jgi:hypothetical protein
MAEANSLSARVKFGPGQINVIVRSPNVYDDLGLVFVPGCLGTLLLDMRAIKCGSFFEDWTDAGQPCEVGDRTTGTFGNSDDPDLATWSVFLRKLIGTGRAAGTACDHFRRSDHTEIIEKFFPGLVLERYPDDMESDDSSSSDSDSDDSSSSDDSDDRSDKKND